ncbi:DNA-directed RNA polymerase specialized sigma24 family protein [Murinocardiopsis flavida]|uniref:DNA-directed RNA polymerase specialized sigma24 family protein n=1 Tax=Murinocardiopsis flavida TaxID=645275 RepID=A0A2P8DJT7_9ACTN|nr:sigma-70 family RNA polymerase sigma factor [Murinocardiopsis flavida]PSK97458.1 DNA-directed RNA polymerase specialized sigma24 family protein [Murinocardiopsis flavida]
MARPSDTGGSTGRGGTPRSGPERHPAHLDAEHALALGRGHGHDAFYDTFGPALYEYCWALLGPGGDGDEPDRPGAAVREALLAAVELLDRLPDRRLLRPWLFALARAACQRRGFAAEPPYALIATAPEERALVAMVRRLPPSHRELLELYLRHGLAPAQIAPVLALEGGTAEELCRAAVRRAVDALRESAPAPARPGAAQWALVDVAEVVTCFVLPGPPRRLRRQIVADLTAEETARERAGAAEAMLPLGADGFPLHRDRAPAPAPPAEAAAAPAARAPEEPTSIAPDRATTADTPTRRDGEPVAELAPPHAAARPAAGGTRRWIAPAAAGIATVAAALVLWGIGGSLTGPGLVTQGDPPGAAGLARGGGTTGSTAPDRLPPPTGTAEPTAPPQADRPSASAAPDPTRRTGDTAEQPQAPPDDPPGGGPAPEDPPAPPSIPPSPPPVDDPPGGDRDGLGRLLDDLGDLLDGG